jgi:CheY-like chemotaxis protein
MGLRALTAHSVRLLDMKTRPMKILIVDDHAEARALIREVIGNKATEVGECASGEAAIEYCRNHTPDLVTLDIRMGAIDGIEVLNFLTKYKPNVPVVVVTQSNDPSLHALVRRHGAIGSLSKNNLLALREYLDQCDVTQALPTEFSTGVNKR